MGKTKRAANEARSHGRAWNGAGTFGFAARSRANETLSIEHFGDNSQKGPRELAPVLHDGADARAALRDLEAVLGAS
jgi:hypothetical protein